MLDSRLHRVALVVLVVPALVLTAFSLRPSVLPRTAALAPDAFDGVSARSDLRALSRIRDRSPGGKGDAAAAVFVAAKLRAARFKVSLSRGETNTVAGVRSTVIVSGRRTGFSQRRVVLLADRAALGGGTDGLTGTAALLEVARALAGRTLAHSIEIVSTGAGPGGALAGWEPRGGQVVGVLVLGDLGAGSLSRRFVTPWAQLRATAAPFALERSVASAVKSETGLVHRRTGFLERIARLALPVTTTGQGTLVAAAVPAVTLGSTGELKQPADAPVGPRFEGFGRAALRVAGILDGAPRDWPGADSSALPVRDRELPEWTLRLVSGMAVLAGLLVGVDAMARARRRRIRVFAPGVWITAAWPPMLMGWVWLMLASMVGVIDGVPEVMAPVGTVPVSWAAVAGIPVSVAIGWLLLRPLVMRISPGGAAIGPGSPASLMLLTGGAAALIWVRDPLTALLVVPFLHIAPWLVDDERRPSRRTSMLLMAALLVPLVVVLASLATDFGTGPIGLAWQFALVFAAGGAGVGGGLVTTLLAGLYVSALLLVARPRDRSNVTLVTRGPLGYAGPGSLGGTD